MTWLWERDETARQACLLECIGVLEGNGPKPLRKMHLACVVDWALRERYRADVLEKTLRNYAQEAAQTLKESLDMSSDIENAGPRRSNTQH